MAANATRSIAINISGDVIQNNIFEAADNPLSPASITVHALVIGANTITVPTVTGFTVKAATILPPTTNTESITLKGIAGDTGIAISEIDPTSIGFETAPASFVLTAGGTINGLRIVWT
ncbi:MAG: hypothetical protein ABWY25_10180 [Paenisporosarcina sp.]